MLALVGIMHMRGVPPLPRGAPYQPLPSHSTLMWIHPRRPTSTEEEEEEEASARAKRGANARTMDAKAKVGMSVLIKPPPQPRCTTRSRSPACVPLSTDTVVSVCACV